MIIQDIKKYRNKKGANKQRILPLDEPYLKGNEKKYLKECIETGWISWQGPFVTKTEKFLRDYCGTKHCLTVVNGTSALILALQALGIGKGDEVIVPTLTMSATSFAVTTVGATVVWADSVKDEFVIDPKDVESRITPKTKAVIAVHLYGRPAGMEELLKITKPRGIAVIEDCAEGLGAMISNKKVGGLGTIACHSFHNKIVASGEGGAITVNDGTLFNKLSELRTPSPNNEDISGVILNNRMSNIASAVALAQLEKIEDLISRRRNVAKIYNQCFENAPGIKIFKEKKNERCVYWRYQIALTDDYPLTKEELVVKLKKNNIVARPIFSLMSENPYYKRLSSGRYQNAAGISSRAMDLPSGPILEEKDVIRIANLILRFGGVI